jgi:hypothetical protein
MGSPLSWNTMNPIISIMRLAIGDKLVFKIAYYSDVDQRKRNP